MQPCQRTAHEHITAHYSEALRIREGRPQCVLWCARSMRPKTRRARRTAPGHVLHGCNALRSAQADAAIEQYHIDFWTAVGGTPITTTFTRAPADPSAFEARNDVHIALYMAAVREFAELGQPSLAKWAFQAGALKAESRVDARWLQALSGNAAGNPPNNKAFETDLLSAANAIEQIAAA